MNKKVSTIVRLVQPLRNAFRWKHDGPAKVGTASHINGESRALPPPSKPPHLSSLVENNNVQSSAVNTIVNGAEFLSSRVLPAATDGDVIPDGLSEQDFEKRAKPLKNANHALPTKDVAEEEERELFAHEALPFRIDDPYPYPSWTAAEATKILDHAKSFLREQEPSAAEAAAVTESRAEAKRAELHTSKAEETEMRTSAAATQAQTAATTAVEKATDAASEVAVARTAAATSIAAAAEATADAAKARRVASGADAKATRARAQAISARTVASTVIKIAAEAATEAVIARKAVIAAEEGVTKARSAVLSARTAEKKAFEFAEKVESAIGAAVGETSVSAGGGSSAPVALDELQHSRYYCSGSDKKKQQLESNGSTSDDRPIVTFPAEDSATRTVIGSDGQSFSEIMQQFQLQQRDEGQKALMQELIEAGDAAVIAVSAVEEMVAKIDQFWNVQRLNKLKEGVYILHV